MLLERAESLARSDPEGEDGGFWDVVYELHRRAQSDVCERALHWCRADSAALRGLGATVLAQLGRDEGFPFRATSVPLLTGLLKDPAPSVVASAVHALGHLAACDLEQVAQLVHHPSEDVRWALAASLGASVPSARLDVLIELSRDREVRVRDWATFSLGSLSEVDSPELRAALVARLDDEDDETRGEALVGLAVRKDERVLPHLERELRRSSVGRLALDAAGELGDPSLLPLLRALSVRQADDGAIRNALERCGDTLRSDSTG